MSFAIKSEVPLMLVGGTGIGKTEIPRQFAKENGYTLKYLNLGAEEVGDLRGLANFDVTPDGKQITTFAKPDWQQEIMDFCNNNPDKIGIIFLDEANRCKQEVFQVIYPLILERRIGQVVFPKNLYVMAAQNPSTDDYNTAEIDDSAFKARFSYIKVTPNINDWSDYAKTIKVDPGMISFYQDNPKMLYGQYTDFSITKKPAPRLAVMADRFLKTDAPTYIKEEVICGLIGVEAGIMLLKSMNDTQKAVKGVEILNNYYEHRKDFLKYCEGTSVKTDMVNYSINSLLDENNKDIAWNPDQMKNVKTFIDDLPKDSAAVLMRDLYKTSNGRELMKLYPSLHDLIKYIRGLDKKQE